MVATFGEKACEKEREAFTFHLELPMLFEFSGPRIMF